MSIPIHYDTSLLIGKTLDQCCSLINAFNLNLIRSALVILRRERDINDLARRALLKAKINPDNPDLLEELIQTNGLRIVVPPYSFVEKFINYVTYDVNRINVSISQERVDKILSRG